MEVWYDALTKEVKAVYSDRYTGRAWADAGWLPFRNDTRRVPRDLNPGAIADFSGSEPVVTVPALPKPPDPKRVRIGELEVKIGDDSITFDEMKELNRLERGL